MYIGIYGYKSVGETLFSQQQQGGHEPHWPTCWILPFLGIESEQDRNMASLFGVSEDRKERQLICIANNIYLGRGSRMKYLETKIRF